MDKAKVYTTKKKHEQRLSRYLIERDKEIEKLKKKRNGK